MSKDPRWPDYCKKETLAKRLDLAAGMVDQLVKRGLLPAPIIVDGAHIWRWSDVDDHLNGIRSHAQAFDPYDAGAIRARKTSAVRS